MGMNVQPSKSESERNALLVQRIAVLAYCLVKTMQELALTVRATPAGIEEARLMRLWLERNVP